jgi:hypothetical protein
MTSEFLVYLRLGFEHISDLRGYDHILFIVALCAVYQPRQWKQVLVLVTAFTLGHSLTLALATLDLLRINAQLVEILIPVTILLTSAINVMTSGMGGGIAASTPDEGARGRPFPFRTARHLKYALALVFGLIHGLGFSNFLRAALGGGEGITLPLFAFNVGLEVGQILIVLGVLLVDWVVVGLLNVRRWRWVMFASGFTGLASVYLIAQRIVG